MMKLQWEWSINILGLDKFVFLSNWYLSVAFEYYEFHLFVEIDL